MPAGWPCQLWPLGREPHHVEAWLGYADLTTDADWQTEHHVEQHRNRAFGWHPYVQAARLLARAEGVLPDARWGAAMPATKAEARAELRDLRMWLLGERLAVVPVVPNGHQSAPLARTAGGRRALAELAKTDPVARRKQNAYELIRGRKQPGVGAKTLLGQVREDRQLSEILQAAGLPLTVNTIRAALREPAGRPAGGRVTVLRHG